MTRKLLLIALLACSAATFAQGYYTKECTDKTLCRQANAWVDGGSWRNGFRKADPHKSVNRVEFFTQYQKNRAQWDALFRWLAETDLTVIPAGKHPIEGSTLVASVEDSQNGQLAKRQSESHYHHIDFQYVVKGIERFGIIDHETSVVNCAYRPDVIHYDYDVSKARFYDSDPLEFFLFFPSDWHIAKVNTNLVDQNIRVIVVKLDYVE